MFFLLAVSGVSYLTRKWCKLDILFDSASRRLDAHLNVSTSLIDAA